MLCGVVAHEGHDRDPEVGQGLAHLTPLSTRSLRIENGAVGTVNICNTPTSGANTIVEYTGGATASTAEVRNSQSLSGGTCDTIDYDGAGTNSDGDFRIMIPADNTVVFGFAGALFAGSGQRLIAPP